MSALRLFLAVELDESLKEVVNSLMEPLRKTGADVKWVQRANLHMTLKFLGEVADEKLGLIVETARRALACCARFDIGLGGVGTFPPAGKPRVIWIGIEDARAQLAAMSRSLEEAFAQVGFPPEDRPFKPHLTLGRVRSPKGVERLRPALAKTAVPATKPMTVDKVLLIKSVLTSAGPIYTVLERIDLT
jgi:2'-5' RNA ligase